VTFVYGEVLNIMCTKEIPTLWKRKEKTSIMRFQTFQGKNSIELTPT
jgi:hypothetical protein